MSLDFRIIPYAEVDRFERTPHNPPCYDESFTPDEFTREWWDVRVALKQRLEIFGDEWRLATETGDFMLSECRGNSRWIYITLVTTRLWRPEFVYAVADLLSGLPRDYRVGCLDELADNELSEQPLIYLVISSKTVFGCAYDLGKQAVIDRNDVLIQFGFPDPANFREA